MRAVQSLGLRRSLTCLLGACHPGRWRVSCCPEGDAKPARQGSSVRVPGDRLVDVVVEQQSLSFERYVAGERETAFLAERCVLLAIFVIQGVPRIRDDT